MARSIAWAILAAAAAGLCCGSAAARQADGSLGVVVRPNNGMPAIVTPGAAFTAVLTEQTAPRLEGPGAPIVLESAWRPLPGGRHQAVCTVPKDTPPGVYAIAVDGENGVDRTQRAVYVRERIPAYYPFAHITDTHLGKDHRHPRTSDDINRDLIAAINATEAQFVVITGDLTESGEPEQFQRFLAVIDQCTLPTFVCAGNHDRQALHYERYFGPLAYAFEYGEDGYLIFDTKDYITAPAYGGENGTIQRLRRELKPLRYTIGLTHRYEPMMGMRAQLALFVDDPLDYLLFGHWHRENSAEEPAVPWGKTPMFVTPAAIDGKMRLFDMTARGLIPRAVRQGAAAGSGPEGEAESNGEGEPYGPGAG